MPSLGITGGIATGKSSFTDGPAADACPRRASMLTAALMSCSRRMRKSARLCKISLERSPTARMAARIAPFCARWSSMTLRGAQSNWRPFFIRRFAAAGWRLLPRRRPGKNGCSSIFRFYLRLELKAALIMLSWSLAPWNTQLRRLIDGRGLTSDLALKMISTQIDLQTKMSKADHLIWNDSSSPCLDRQAAPLRRLAPPIPCLKLPMPMETLKAPLRPPPH